MSWQLSKSSLAAKQLVALPPDELGLDGDRPPRDVELPQDPPEDLDRGLELLGHDLVGAQAEELLRVAEEARPHDDLHGFRGFYEPYREQWLVWDEEATLAEAGFVGFERRDVAPPLWSVVCQKPG